MGERDTPGDGLAERRAFVRRLSNHEDVRRVDFTRDGLRTILVELEPDADFHDQWHRTATRLGYTVEQLGDGRVLAPGWPADAWILRLTAPDQSAERATWRTTVRGAETWVRTVLDRLLSRSKQ